LKIKKNFYERLNNIISNAKFTIISVAIDKKKHIEKYGKIADNPYSICLSYILERLIFCTDNGNLLPTVSITIEKRGKKEDEQLLAHYNEIIELASEIKNHIKSQKIAGKSIFMSDKRKPEGTEKMKKKILIAEDDLNLQKLLKVNLESRGFDVVAVDDGEKALVEFYNILPDLFITDVMLPKIWGLDVCRGIRKSGQFKDIPILIMSGVYNKLEFRIDAQQAGATDMITKPFEIEDFTKYVEKLIAQTKPSSASAASSVKTTMPSDLTKNYSVDKKVVVYYPDGKIIKGITAAMNPGGTGFNMTLKDENKRAYIAYAQVSRVEVVDKF